jgi:hypothetical protein
MTINVFLGIKQVNKLINISDTFNDYLYHKHYSKLKFYLLKVDKTQLV